MDTAVILKRFEPADERQHMGKAASNSWLPGDEPFASLHLFGAERYATKR